MHLCSRLFVLSLLTGYVFCQASTQAWIFPGQPGCAAPETYHTYNIDVLKPQYFDIADDGSVQLLDDQWTCNMYNESNAADIKAHSKQQFITTSCHYSAMVTLINSQDLVTAAVNTFLTFLQQNQFTGIEIDCEEYEKWSSSDFSGYVSFLTQLGNTLHSNGFELMIDGPAISDEDSQGAYPNFKYEEFEGVPVDYLAAMVYDNQYAYSSGVAVAPNNWTVDCTNWMINKISNISRIVIGMPSYGYYGPQGTNTITEITKVEAETYPGFNTASRDSGSYEMMWSNSGVFYDYQDTSGLDSKRALIESLGIQHISVWHLGGNDWFSS